MLSRQYRWQIKQKDNGNCTNCGDPSFGKIHCDYCACIKHGVKYRKHLKSEWLSVDWSQTNTTIAKQFGVTLGAITYQRKKYNEKKEKI